MLCVCVCVCVCVRVRMRVRVRVCFGESCIHGSVSPNPPDAAVVFQAYDSDVNKEYVIRGNSAIMKCSIPSFVADFVTVTAWVTDQGETFYPSDRYGKHLFPLITPAPPRPHL